MIKKIANWGNYPVIEADEKTFRYQYQLDALVESVPAYIPRGNGRCYGDASLAAHVISTLRFDNIISFDPGAGIFECESGIMLDAILKVIVPKGWFLPVTPGTKFITVGGAVASDVHGKNHHVDGSFSAHIIDMDVKLADGHIVTCSASVNEDLFEASCGGMGLTGMITRVKFSLKKIETSYIRQKQLKAKNLNEILEMFDRYNSSTYSVAWIDCLKKGENFGRSILMLGEHAQWEDLSETQKKAPLKLAPDKQIPFPFNFPSWVLNRTTIQIFNALYYGKNLKKEINNIIPYEPFFYPLDAFSNWNRVY